MSAVKAESGMLEFWNVGNQKRNNRPFLSPRHHQQQICQQPSATVTNSTMIAARRAVVQAAARAQARCMSTAAAPKTHKAKDVWRQIEATRPKDPHPHVSSDSASLSIVEYEN